LRKVPLFFPWILAVAMALFATAFFPSARLMPFAPFLALAYYRLTLSKALWVAFGCGLVLDLLSSDLRIGIYGLNFALATLFLYTRKRHFFEDKPIAFSLFSSLISLTCTLIQLFFLYLLDQTIPLGEASFFSDLVAMPILDGLYAFLWFTCPMKLYDYIQRRGLFKEAEENDEAP